MFSNLRIKQNNIIANFNLLVDELEKSSIEFKSLKKLNSAGICNGITFNGALHYHANTLNEFILSLHFFAALKPGDIKNLVERYKNSLTAQTTLRINIGQNNLIPFEKLIALIQGVEDAQFDQILRQIGANWDRTYSFICTTSQLTDYLKLSEMQAGDLVLVSMGFHIFLVIKTDNGFYLLEPNNITQTSIDDTKLKSEEDLTHAIIANSCSYFPFTLNDNFVAFSMLFISYGNRPIDDLLAEQKNKLISLFPETKSLFDAYRNKTISRMSLALELKNKIKDVTDSEDFNQFKKFIEQYTQDELRRIDSTIINSEKYLSSCAYTYKKSWLILVVQYQLIEIIDKLIEKGANLNHQSPTGAGLIHTAAQISLDIIVKKLIQHGVNPCQKSSNGATPLHISAEFNTLKVFNTLLPFYTDLNLPCTVKVWQLLEKANNLGKRNEFKNMLLSHTAAKVLPEELSGFTPLHIATFFGNTLIVKTLLEKGADPNIKASGFTAFQFAQFFNYTEIINLLKKPPYANDAVKSSYALDTPILHQHNSGS